MTELIEKIKERLNDKNYSTKYKRALEWILPEIEKLENQNEKLIEFIINDIKHIEGIKHCYPEVSIKYYAIETRKEFIEQTTNKKWENIIK